VQTPARTTRDESSIPRDLLVELTLRRGQLRHGLQHALRAAIQNGRLAAGTMLPASRRLAADLGVSRGVVADTYDQLAAECYLLIEPRRAPVVAAVPATRPPQPDAGRPQYRVNFVATTPDVELFSRRAWGRAIERALRTAPNDALDYADHRGRPELRTELAAYLGRVRGVRITPDRIVVTQGFTQALDLACRVLRGRGATELWFESPSLADEWETVAASGLRVRAVRVDADGLRTAELPELGSAAVVVTPAHQFPTGAVLSPQRRHALVSWARRNDGLIVEDDYDAEFRYDRAAIGAVQGLDPERVVHIGTASKTLAPGLRLGWMSLPEGLVAEVRTAKAAADSGSPAIDQLAFAGFLASGEYDRHVARVRQIYRQRRDRLVASLARRLPNRRVEGAAAGLHVVVRLPGVDDRAVARAAAERGIGVRALSEMSLLERAEPGLILGYGRLSAERIDEAVAELVAVLRATVAGPAAPTGPAAPAATATSA
jgi:GntR family transcriptional regulator/MocR family aminotransferase